MLFNPVEHLCATCSRYHKPGVGDILIVSRKEINKAIFNDLFKYPVQYLTVPTCESTCDLFLKDVKKFKVVFAIDDVADALLKLRGRVSDTKFQKFHFKKIPLPEYWLCPIPDPQSIFDGYDYSEKVKYHNHLLDGIDLLKTEKPKVKVDIRCTTNPVEASLWLETLYQQEKILSFDYETTGLKPYKPEHKIKTIAISCKDYAVACPMFDDAPFQAIVKEILTSKKVSKIAHNLNFENIWTKTKLGYYPEHYCWDTQIAAHCLNQNDSTSLKFQIFCELGIIYDNDIDQYLKGNKKDSHSLNNIDRAPLDKLLFYNGMDAFLTYKLYEIQYNKADDHLKKGISFFTTGAQTCSKLQQNGITINPDRLQENKRRLDKKISLMLSELQKSKEAKIWYEKEHKELNIKSNQQLIKLFNYLGFNVSSVDEESLSSIKTKFSSDIINYRKLFKISNTYLAGYEKEIVDNKINPFYSLSFVSTFRSSSDSPNLHNVPKRDKYANSICRSIIKPSPGNKIIEYDYKSLEVCIGCCYHKDPNMIKYVTDPTTDMHRDTTLEVFIRDLNTFTKDERSLIKSFFVFASFYGSTAYPRKGETIGQITLNLWNEMSKETMLHLKEKGIKNIRTFQDHVIAIEDSFWQKRFPVYKAWKSEIWDKYQKTGYVELYTGFRCYNPLDRRQVANYPIQGSAFHCLLYTLNNTINHIENLNNKKSKLICQIHDAIIADVFPDDESQVDRLINYYGTKKIREDWDWIIIPLKLEKECSEINGSWNAMK